MGVCAQQLGVVERALELTAAYARERKQFDHVIGGFQAVRQRLADAYVDVEAVRLTTQQAAWRLGADLPATEAVATAKFWAAEAGPPGGPHAAGAIATATAAARKIPASKRFTFPMVPPGFGRSTLPPEPP